MHITDAADKIQGMAIFTGGLVQLLAGMWEFPRGNVFGATGERSSDFPRFQSCYQSGQIRSIVLILNILLYRLRDIEAVCLAIIGSQFNWL